MTNEEARRVLEKIDFPSAYVWNWRQYVKDSRVARTFYGMSPDQLEAIAMWMRDPQGVMPAAFQPVP